MLPCDVMTLQKKKKKKDGTPVVACVAGVHVDTFILSQSHPPPLQLGCCPNPSIHTTKKPEDILRAAVAGLRHENCHTNWSHNLHTYLVQMKYCYIQSTSDMCWQARNFTMAEVLLLILLEFHCPTNIASVNLVISCNKVFISLIQH